VIFPALSSRFRSFAELGIIGLEVMLWVFLGNASKWSLFHANYSRVRLEIHRKVSSYEVYSIRHKLTHDLYWLSFEKSWKTKKNSKIAVTEYTGSQKNYLISKCCRAVQGFFKKKVFVVFQGFLKESQ
jgi:hypothetical protein